MYSSSDKPQSLSVGEFIQDKPCLRFHKKDSVCHIVSMMQESHVYAGLVIEKDRLAGLLTEHNILVYLIRWLAQPNHRAERLKQAFNVLKAEDVMVKFPVTLDFDTKMECAAEIINENGFRYMPVDYIGDPVGIIGRLELSQYVEKKNGHELETKDAILSYLMHHENYGCL